MASGAAIEDHVFHPLAERRLDVFIDGQLPGVDDAHVESGVDGVVQERGIECLADGVVAAEGEGDVAHAAGDLHVGQQFLDLPRGLDEIHAVAGVLLDAGADGQDVRVENDVGRLHARLFREQLIGPAGDVDLVLHADGLALLVEHHHHAGRAVLSHQSGVGQELLFAFLEADRVDDRLALHALQTRLQHGPVRAVDHHGHAGHVGLGGQQVEELGHHLRPVQQALVHVDVDDVRPALDLLPGDGNGLGQVAFADQPGELLRPGDIGPLADHDERAVGADHQRFQAAEDRIVAGRRRSAGRLAAHGVGDRADVGRRRAAAAADDVHPAVVGEFAQHGGHLRRRLVVAAELVGQPGIGMATRPQRAKLRKFFDVGPHQRRAQGAVDAHAQQIGMLDRGQEGGQRLPGERAAAEIGDRHRDHHRHFDPPLGEQVVDGEQAGLEVERVEDSLGQEDIGAAVDQGLGLFVVGGREPVEVHGPIAGVVDVRRERGGAIRGADRTGDEGA